VIDPAALPDHLLPGRPVPLRGLSRATLADGTVADLELTDGTVAAALPPGTLGGPDVLDLQGWVLTTAGADAHAHLDKSASLGGRVPAYGDLLHAIEQWLVIGAESDEDDHYRRARATALEMVGHGLTAVRSHCNLFRGNDPLLAIRALLRVKADLADVLDLEICVLPSPESPTADIVAAMEAGADIMGGCPHLADDPEIELDRLLELARKFGTGIDIHADEQLTPDMLSVRSLARRVRDEPLAGTVTAGHCVSLGTLDQPLLAEVVAELAAGGVGVVTLPITNLYLQGWDHAAWKPRGLTAVRALLDGGVTLAAGGDNVRDPFNPVGRADPLETVALLVVAGHLTIEEALHAATSGSRAVMGLPPAGTRPGDVADLLACKGSDLADVVARAPEDRVVLRRGAVVAASCTRRASAAR
jgi:cytosine/creatinine deaminase